MADQHSQYKSSPNGPPNLNPYSQPMPTVPPGESDTHTFGCRLFFFKLNFSRMKQVEVLTNRKWRSQEHVADIFMLFIFKGSNLFCLDNIDIKQLDTYRMLL